MANASFRRFLFPLVAFLTISCTHRAGHTQERIIGGEEYAGLPAVGAVLHKGLPHCTGTLVAPRRVLTAGHCVRGYKAQDLSFVIGPDSFAPEHVLLVIAAKAHPGLVLTSSRIDNDVAYLTLSKDAPVPPLPVVQLLQAADVGREIFLVGYGANDGYAQTGYGKKRKAHTKIKQIGAHTIRFDRSATGANTCNGDSGGPAFVQAADGAMEVVGVTSYGDMYCQTYGVDMRADFYREFILEDIGEPITGGDPCVGVGVKGECSGNVLLKCVDHVLESVDCAKSFATCGELDGVNHCLVFGTWPVD